MVREIKGEVEGASCGTEVSEGHGIADKGVNSVSQVNDLADELPMKSTNEDEDAAADVTDNGELVELGDAYEEKQLTAAALAAAAAQSQKQIVGEKLLPAVVRLQLEHAETSSG